MFEGVKRYIVPKTDEDLARADKIDQRLKGGLLISLTAAAVVYMQTPEAETAQADIQDTIGSVACGIVSVFPPKEDIPPVAWMARDAVRACQ